MTVRVDIDMGDVRLTNAQLSILTMVMLGDPSFFPIATTLATFLILSGTLACNASMAFSS